MADSKFVNKTTCEIRRYIYKKKCIRRLFLFLSRRMKEGIDISKR